MYSFFNNIKVMNPSTKFKIQIINKITIIKSNFFFILHHQTDKTQTTIVVKNKTTDRPDNIVVTL